VVGSQNQGVAHMFLTAHQVAQPVVAVQIHGAVAAVGLRDTVQLPIAGVGIGQGGAILVGDALGAAQVVIFEGDCVAISVGLRFQQAVSCQLFIGRH
jgi:hypothetical protein